MKNNPLKTTEKNGDMTTGSIPRHIILFTIPVFIGNLLQQIYTIVDAIVVGQCVGVEGLAAIGATDWIYWLFLWTAVGFCQGFAINIAISFGRKDMNELKDSINAALTLSMAVGIGMSVTGLIIARPLLDLLQTPENIAHDSWVFVSILYAGMIIVMLYNMSANILRALGDGTTPFIALAISSLLNVALDLLAVGALGMGVKGAALATVTAQAVSVVYSFVKIRHLSVVDRSVFRPRIGLGLGRGLMYHREDAIESEKRENGDAAVAEIGLRRILRDPNPLLGQTWKKGLVMALQMVFIAVGGVLVQFVVNGLGFLYVAGYAAGGKLLGLIESLALSLGQGITTFIGQNYGACDLPRMKRGMRAAAAMSLVCYFITGVIIYLLGQPLLGLFIDADAEVAGEVMAIAQRYLLMLIIFMIFLYMIHIYRQALVGTGRTFLALLSGCVETVTRIGVSVGLVQFVSIEFLYFIEPITWAGAGIFACIAWFAVFHRMEKLA